MKKVLKISVIRHGWSFSFFKNGSTIQTSTKLLKTSFAGEADLLKYESKLVCVFLFKYCFVAAKLSNTHGFRPADWFCIFLFGNIFLGDFGGMYSCFGGIKMWRCGIRGVIFPRQFQVNVVHVRPFGMFDKFKGENPPSEKPQPTLDHDKFFEQLMANPMVR